MKVEAFYEVQNFSLDCFNEESFSVVKQYTQFNMDCKSLCTERNFSKFYAKVSVKSWLLFILIFKDYDLEEKSWTLMKKEYKTTFMERLVHSTEN